jgi:cytochrome b
MSRVLIWDLPTRLFHWLLASGFSIAAVIAPLLGDDSSLFPYHSIIGLALALMVGLRLVCGLLGTRHARSSSLTHTPHAVITYLFGVLPGAGPRHVGHNPASAYAIIAMLGLILALAATGIMMGTGNQSVEDIHEFLAYATLVVIGAHVLGVIIHTVRFKENITASMIHGRKHADPAHAIRSARPLTAALFLIITGAFALSLLARYDPATQQTTLPLLGTKITLGEPEDRAQDGAKDEPGAHDARRPSEEDDDD